MAVTTFGTRDRIEITRGATFAHVFTWNTPAGVDVNVTGYTGKFTIDNRDGTEAFSSTSAVTLGGSAGTATVVMTAVQTAALSRASAHGGRYSVVLTAPGGSIVPLADGLVGVLEVPGL